MFFYTLINLICDTDLLITHYIFNKFTIIVWTIQNNDHLRKELTTVRQCILLVFGANSKNIASKALPSHTIIASELYLTYPQDVVQVLCLSPTTLNLLMNAFVHPYLVFYVILISRIIFFLLITSILIFILSDVGTHTVGICYTHDICIIFFKENICFYNLLINVQI